MPNGCRGTALWRHPPGAGAEGASGARTLLNSQAKGQSDFTIGLWPDGVERTFRRGVRCMEPSFRLFLFIHRSGSLEADKV